MPGGLRRIEQPGHQDAARAGLQDRQGLPLKRFLTDRRFG